MSVLLFIEEKLERKRNKKNDPRTCDIDIIDYNSQILEKKFGEKTLQIPHPKMVSRNFVLYPLQEIEPNWRHPKTEENISFLIKNLSKENLIVLKKFVSNSDGYITLIKSGEGLNFTVPVAASQQK